MSLNIFNVVEFRSERIVDIDNDDFPVRLTLIKKCHDAKDLDLLDLTSVANELTNFTDIERVIVTFGFGLWVNLVWVLPSLQLVSLNRDRVCSTYSWESTVIPDVSFVWETVADESKLALLNILLDRVEEFFFGDLPLVSSVETLCWSLLTSCFAFDHLGISTTMFSTVCCSLAYRGMSWNGETGWPFFSM